MVNRENGPEDFYEGGLDEFKRLALLASLETSHNMDRLGISEVTASRGEAAQVIDLGDRFIATVNEELGTKNIVADAMQKITGECYYFGLGVETALAQLNDLITVGAEPISSQAHFVTGDRSLFNDPVRSSQLIQGYKEGCNLAGANWMGGETGLLEGNVEPGRVILSGSATGIIWPRERLTLGDKLQPGDHIIYLPSNGVHANGYTGLRKLEEHHLRYGYETRLTDGTTFGEALLAITPSYVDAARSLFESGIDIHYMANITGHGLRKLMRANRELTYVMDSMPKPQAIFDFIQQRADKTDREMCGEFNMGLGFAVFVSAEHADVAIDTLRTLDIDAEDGGHVEEGPKRVVITPKNLVFESDSLEIR